MIKINFTKFELLFINICMFIFGTKLGLFILCTIFSFLISSLINMCFTIEGFVTAAISAIIVIPLVFKNLKWFRYE